MDALIVEKKCINASGPDSGRFQSPSRKRISTSRSETGTTQFLAAVQIVITDFDLIDVLLNIIPLKTFYGTPKYATPEVRYSPVSVPTTGLQADVWILKYHLFRNGHMASQLFHFSPKSRKKHESITTHFAAAPLGRGLGKRYSSSD